MKLTAGFPKVSARFYKLNENLSVPTVGKKSHKYSLVTYMPKTIKTLRLYSKIRAWQFPRIYFKVWYGFLKTNKGKMRMFYNDAIMYNKEEALKTLKAFLE